MRAHGAAAEAMCGRHVCVIKSRQTRSTTTGVSDQQIEPGRQSSEQWLRELAEDTARLRLEYGLPALNSEERG